VIKYGVDLDRLAWLNSFSLRRLHIDGLFSPGNRQRRGTQKERERKEREREREREKRLERKKEQSSR